METVNAGVRIICEFYYFCCSDYWMNEWAYSACKLQHDVQFSVWQTVGCLLFSDGFVRMRVGRGFSGADSIRHGKNLSVIFRQFICVASVSPRHRQRPWRRHRLHAAAAEDCVPRGSPHGRRCDADRPTGAGQRRGNFGAATDTTHLDRSASTTTCQRSRQPINLSQLCSWRTVLPISAQIMAYSKDFCRVSLHIALALCGALCVGLIIKGRRIFSRRQFFFVTYWLNRKKALMKYEVQKSRLFRAVRLQPKVAQIRMPMHNKRTTRH